MTTRPFALFLITCQWLLSAAIGTAQSGTGLTGKYYDTENFGSLMTTRTDATVNFNFGTSIPAGTALTAPTTYSIIWSGQIEPQFSELYTFSVTADDGARLWVDDQMIVGRNFYQTPAEMRGQIRLKAGHRVNLRLEFIQRAGGASVKLEWASASQARQVVPALRLYPATVIPNGGSVMREVWHGLAGSSLSTMTSNANYPNRPASREFLTSFECLARDWADSFGTRVTGFIRAPVTGTYTFAVSGDDVVELYLSTDASPANKSLIASSTTATAFRDFKAKPSQQSTPRTLVAGRQYYVELLHKENTGADHWSVAWMKPGDTELSIIPGTALMMPGTDLATPSTSDYFNTLATEQPRLGVTRERFTWLKQQYLSPVASNAKSRAQAIINTANSDLSAGFDAGRADRDRIERMATAWWLTGNPAYPARVMEVMLNAHANGYHLDKWKGLTISLTALGYDWLYPAWTAAERTTLMNYLVKRGLDYQSNILSFGPNIGMINDSGFIMAALAVGTGNESAAEADLSQAVSQLAGKLNHFNANSGAWLEGTDYGIFAKWGFAPGMESLETALGSSFGLSRTAGLHTAAREPLHIASNTRQRFTFSDVGTASHNAVGWANWWARRFDALEVYDFSRLVGNSARSALVLPETTLPPASAGLNPDRAFRGPVDSSPGLFQDVVTLRENWTDSKATFVGGMGGTYMAHGMLQSGTFQMSARGVNWFVDLKSEGYSIPNHNVTQPNPNGPDRWDYYRNRAEGHNCLIVNPTANPDRIWNAPSAPMIAYQSAQNGQRSFAVWDLSKNITGVTRVQRGIKLLGQRKQVLIQDEIVNPTATTCWWFAHFRNSGTTATISGDGSSVTLQSGTERLWGKIVSGSGVWTVRAAVPLPTSPNPPENADNSAFSKLAIQLNGVTNTTLAVWFVPLAPGENPPITTPAVTTLATWNLVAENDAPIASNGSVSSDTLTTDVDLRLYASDDWTYPHSMTFAVGNPQGGTVTLLPDGHTARFTQPLGASAPLGFTFTATDEDGLTSNPGSIVVGVTPVHYVWTSLTSGNWSDAAKWSGGSVPASNPAAQIEFLTGITPGSSPITATHNLPGTTILNSLTLAGNGSASTVNISGGSLSLASNGSTSPTIRSTSPVGSVWNVNSDISLGENTAVSNDASSLTFSGTLSGAGGLAIDGAGPVSFTGSSANTFSGESTLLGDAFLTLAKSSGINAIAGNLTIGDASGGALLWINQNEQIANTSILSFDSGQGVNSSTLRITGGKTETVGGLQTLVAGQSPVIEGSGAGTATLIVNSASSFNYDGVIRNGSGGTFALTKQGSGTLTLRNALGAAPTDFSGATTISAGTLSLTSNPGATGSGRVIENWGANIASSGTLDFNNSSGTETFSRALTGSGGLTKAGTGTVVLSAIQSFNGTTIVRGGTLVIPASGGFNRATGGTLQASTGGTFQYNSPLQSRFGSIIVGNGGGGGISRLIQSSGTLIGSSLVLNNGFTGHGAGQVDLSGGLLSISGSVTLSNQVAGDNIWSTLTVSNDAALTITGSLNHTGAPSSGRNAAGRVVQTGGTITVGGAINLARSTAGNSAPRRGEYHLNGGVLTTSQVVRDAGTDTFGTFQFNGGTLRSSASSTSFFQGLTRAVLRDGGAVIDTNGYNITIAQDLLHSDIGGDQAFDGGVTKSGAGKLILSGNNTYTGDTTVNEGTLSLAQVNSNNEDASVMIAPGATLELTHGAADTVGRLFIGSTVQPAGTYQAIGNPGSGIEIPQITGSGQLIVTGSSGVATWNTTSGTWSTDRANWDGVAGIPWNALNGPINDALINVITGGAPTVTGTVYARSITVGKSSNLTISGSGRIQSAASLLLGSGGSGALTHDSSATSVFGGITAGIGTSNTGIINLTGGSIQATSLTLGAVFSSGAGNVVIGSASGNSATMNISGNVAVSAASSGAQSTLTVEPTGHLSIAGNLAFCTVTTRSGNGRVTQNGGSVAAASLNLSGNVSDATPRTHTSVYDLNGGSLTLGAITSGIVTTTGTIDSTFNFNGGTLKAASDNSSFWVARNTTTANIKTGGAIIDTNGKNITVGQALVPFAGATTASLTKSGTGTLTLAGVNTYNGPTHILAGTLALASTGTIANSPAITIAPGAALDLTSKPAFTLAGSQPLTFKLDGSGPGSSGRIHAAGLNITAANIVFDITTPLDDPVYILASYTSKTGSAFATVTPPPGYALNYAYNGNQIALVTTSGFAGWINGFLELTDSTPAGDPDHDGIVNLLEYVLNGNPGSSDLSILPTLDASGTNFVFSFTRREQSTNDTTQIFEYGSDLSGWTALNITAPTAAAVTLGTASAGLQTVTVTIPKTLAGPSGKLFGRLRVTQP